jgi:hypothetical protein
LCRKRQSPLGLGQPKSWACGIVYVLGRVNFLDDRDVKHVHAGHHLEQFARDILVAEPDSFNSCRCQTASSIGDQHDSIYTFATACSTAPVLLWILRVIG